MEIDDKIKQLEDKIAELKAALLSARRSLFKARVAEIVHAKFGSYVFGNPRKENGDWSKGREQQRLLVKWEIKK